MKGYGPPDALVALRFAGIVTRAVELAGGPAFRSFDIDFVDPAFAPAAASPVEAGS